MAPITAAGSVITEDVDADALAVARGVQMEKPGWAKAFRERKQREKVMCGIVGIAGTRDVAPVILEALKRLEYRGYDSAGIATLVDGQIERRRAPGKLTNLEAVLRAGAAAGPVPASAIPAGPPMARRPKPMPIPMPPRASRSCITASSRISASCASELIGQGPQVPVRDRQRSGRASGHRLSRPGPAAGRGRQGGRGAADRRLFHRHDLQGSRRAS